MKSNGMKGVDGISPLDRVLRFGRIGKMVRRSTCTALVCVEKEQLQLIKIFDADQKVNKKIL